MMKLRLATVASITVKKHVVRIRYTLNRIHYDDDFIVLELYDKYDAILDLTWLGEYDPCIGWHHQSVLQRATFHQMAIW